MTRVLSGLVPMVFAMTCLLVPGCGREAPGAAEAAGAQASENEAVAGQERVDFTTLFDNLDHNIISNTSLSIQQSWREVEGREVRWSAEVVDVKPSRGMAAVYAKRGERPLYRGYNLVFTVFDQAAAGNLRKGDTAMFQGTLQRYSSRRGRPVVVYVNNVQIVDGE